MEELLLQKELYHSTFIFLCRFLHILILLKPAILSTFISHAEEKLSSLPESSAEFLQSQKTLLTPVFCYNTENKDVKEQCIHYFNGISTLLCDILNGINKSISNATDRNLSSIISILCIFRTCFSTSGDITSWFSTDIARQFWKPLVRVVSKNDVMISNALQTYTIQHRTISLFQNILYLNPMNQEYFSQLLIELLTENKQRQSAINGYMKLLLLQLVIAEDTIIVRFKSKSKMYILQNTHKIHVRITATLNEIEQTLLKIRGSLNMGSNGKSNGEKPATAVTQSDSLNTTSNSDLPGYMLNAGAMAVSKRKPKSKPDAKASNTTETNGKLAIDFYLSALSDKPLPKDIQFGQILQLLYEKDSDYLKKSPLLEYGISNGKEGDMQKDNNLNNELKNAPSLCTMLETFSKHDGLSFLTSQFGSQRASSSTNYLTLFSMILPLPGFSKVFLKDRIKAEYLLRLMLGIKETKSGRKYIFI